MLDDERRRWIYWKRFDFQTAITMPYSSRMRTQTQIKSFSAIPNRRQPRQFSLSIYRSDYFDLMMKIRTQITHSSITKGHAGAIENRIVATAALRPQKQTLHVRVKYEIVNLSKIDSGVLPMPIHQMSIVYNTNLIRWKSAQPLQRPIHKYIFFRASVACDTESGLQRPVPRNTFHKRIVIRRKINRYSWLALENRP